MLKSLDVLALTRYGILGASSRLRFFQYSHRLASLAELRIQCSPLFDDSVLASRYQRGRHGSYSTARCFARRFAALWQRRQFDLLWVEKEALPYFPFWVEATLLSGLPYVLDFDDAVFHNYDQHRWALVRWTLGKRLDRLMANAALVVGGNSYLAQRARSAGAPWVEILPTVIDMDRYPSIKSLQDRPVDGLPKIVWIGSPSTVRYLQALVVPLQDLAQRLPFVLRVIGADFALPGVNVECLSWAEDTEVASIAACDVGVMPLQDSLWERGKCGYKLIQYMACGLPVVASSVGVNSSIVQNGVNGLLANDAAAWVGALERLLTQPSLRQRMGAAGRQSVEQEYCLQVTAPKLAAWLSIAAGKG